MISSREEKRLLPDTYPHIPLSSDSAQEKEIQQNPPPVPPLESSAKDAQCELLM